MKGLLYWDQPPKESRFVVGKVIVLPGATLGFLMAGYMYKDIAEGEIKRLETIAKTSWRWQVFSVEEWKQMYDQAKTYHEVERHG